MQQYYNIQDFERNRIGGSKFETGDILFYKEMEDWVAVAGQFAQAYSDSLFVESCVRQLLFFRPSLFMVMDHITANEGKKLPSIQWLLQAPTEPTITINNEILITNGNSKLSVTPVGLDLNLYPPLIKKNDFDSWSIALDYNTGKYGENKVDGLLIVTIMKINQKEDSLAEIDISKSWANKDYFDIEVNGKAFRFNLKPPYEVQSAGWWHKNFQSN